MCRSFTGQLARVGMMQLHQHKTLVLVISVVFGFTVLLLFISVDSENSSACSLSQYVLPPDIIPQGVKLNARSAEYCNLPLKPIEGVEGDVISEDLLLLSVHVIMRHGDHDVDYDQSNVFKDFDPKLNCDMDPRLLRSHRLIRSYVRKMERFRRMLEVGKMLFPHDDLYPHRPLCNGSHLTGVGAVQALVIGDHLRRKYNSPGRQWDGRKLRNDDVVVRCTEKLRTYQNALAVVYMFLPHLNPNEIDIRVLEKRFCDENITGMACKCQGRKVFESEDRAYSVNHHKQDARFQKLLAEIADVYNTTKVLSTQHPWPFLDTLMALFCHNASNNMCNAAGKCITHGHIKALWENLDRAEAYWKNPRLSMQRYRTLSGLPLMTEIVTRLKKQVVTRKKRRKSKRALKFDSHLNASKTPIFVIYSGHGDSVAFALEVIKAFTQRWPPYASRIVIESYVHLPSATKLVRFVYNGRDITRDVPFCKNNMRIFGRTSLCTEISFSKFILHDVYRLFHGLSYNEACRLNTSNINKSVS